MKYNLLISFLIFVFGAAKMIAQDEYITNNILAPYEHINCILVAEDKDYFTYVKPSPHFISAPGNKALKTSTINVTYNGFSPEAQSAFQFAIDILETEITSLVTIEVVANWTSLGTGILGSAGAKYIVKDFPSAPLSDTWYPAAVANKLAGFDLSAANPDITANFNSDFSNWYFGTDGNTPAGQYDFVSVVLHEIIHGLGFSGSMNVSGGTGSWGASGFPYVYDVYAINSSDQRLLNTALFPNPSVSLGTQLRSNDIFFDGANSVSGNVGTNPKLYTPATWSQGSSYSHWDETTYPAGNINSLMTYAIGSAEAIHHIGYITRGLLKDIGWTINQPLPVELSSFDAKVLKNNGVHLNWLTETEVNNYGFEILRSKNPEEEYSKWDLLGFVKGYGNSNSPKEYSFIDSPTGHGNYFYLLKQIDNNGKFSFSKVIEIYINVPADFELSQNYPNPFNPLTTISFSIPVSGYVSLKIFDLLGNEVAILISGEKTAGTYKVNFNGENLSSGIYFYTLQAGSYIETKKLILVK